MNTPITGRVNQIISDLERLKSRVASIESNYNVLSENYAQLCEEAISLLTKRNSSDNKGNKQDPVIARVDDKLVIISSPSKSNSSAAKNKQQLNDIKEIKETVRKTAVIMENLDIKPIPSQSLEDIIVFQYEQNLKKTTGTTPKKKTTNIRKRKKAKANVKEPPPKKNAVQSVIDIIGDGIETGLDKIGDGLIYPFAKISELSQKIYNSPERKQP